MAQGAPPPPLRNPARSTSSIVAKPPALDAASAMGLLTGGAAGVQRWNDLRAHDPSDNQPRFGLDGVDLRGAQLIGCNLAGVSLPDANFVGADLSDADLSGADLSNATLDGLALGPQRVKLMDTTLQGASLRNADLRGCTISAQQLAGADLSSAKLPSDVDIGEQLKVVEEASKNSRTLFLSVLGACFFTFLTIGQTRDADLLFGGGASALPFVGTEIPTIGFYYVTPVVLFGLFLYQHLYLQQLWRLMADLPARFPDGRRMDYAVYPWLLSGLTTRYVRHLSNLSGDYTALRWLASLVTAWMIVPITAWYVWGRAVARHDPWLSGVHLLALLGTSLLALYSFRKMQATLGGKPGLGITQTADRLLVAAWLGAIVAISGLALVWSKKAIEETTAAWHREHSVDPLLGAQEQLYAPGWRQVLGHHPLTVGVSARDAKLAGRDLSDLDLRIADLTHADLVGARVTDTWLHGANLTDANLDRANASGSSFVGADFTGSSLIETVLTNADLRDAQGLTEAQIQAACGTGHVLATVEGYPKRYWFKLRPCKGVAERLRREQAAAEARARQAKTEAEKKAAEAEAKRVAAEADQVEAQEVQAAEAMAGRAEVQQAPPPQTRPPKEPTRKEEPSKPSAPPFDKDAAAQALAAAASTAANCRAPDGPTGTGKAIVTFAPSGRVTSANVSGPPFAGTSTGGCVASKFRAARVPAFSGPSVAVSKTFVVP